MTTLELAERLARRLRGGNLTKLAMAEVMDIVEALNAGQQEAFELLPAWQRRTTVNLYLAAPTSLSIGVTNGSVDLSSGTFSASWVGRSVVVDGDPNWNEVQSATKLLDEYLGTTGTRTATVYGDSTYSDQLTFDGFAKDPLLADQREALIRHDPRNGSWTPEVGRPKFYWLEPAAASLGATPAVYLRVHPAPDIAYTLRCDMEFRPIVVRYDTLNSAATLVLADHLIHRALIPLCEVRLLRSPAWANPKIAEHVHEDARAARAMLASQRTDPAVPNNRVGTPAGY
jgi:hypothetical protein